MSETADAPQTVEQRLGPKLYRKRIEREQSLTRPYLIRRGNFLGEILPGYAIIDAALKLTGLSKSGYQNFLNLQIVEQPVSLKNLPDAFEGFRLLQLSDLHLDLHTEMTAVILDKLKGLEYDLAVITGDYRDSTHGHHGVAIEETEKVVSALEKPVYAILGNHDFISKVEPLESVGLTMLLNESAHVEREGQRLYFAGVDDPSFYRTHDLEAATCQIPADACTILLSHSPDLCHEAARTGFAYMLSGHTHGGQICLPGGIPLIHHCRAGRRYVAGAWECHGMPGYTSRGTGACRIAARFNCPPEMTIHILKRA